MANAPSHSLLEQANHALETGDADQAIGIAQHLLQYAPEVIEAHRLLGEAYLHANQPQQALAAFEQVLHSDPESVAAYYGLGLAHQALDQRIEAIHSFERALEIQPNLSELRTQLMRLYAETPGSPGQFRLSRSGLGRLYARGEMFSQAIDEFQSVLASEPDRDDVRVALAETLWRDGQEDEATDWCRQCVAHQPDLLKPTLILGYLQLAAGQPDGETLWRHAAMQDPELAVAHTLFDIMPPIHIDDLELPPFDYTAWQAARAEQVAPATTTHGSSADIERFASSWPIGGANEVAFGGQQPAPLSDESANDDDFLASLLGFTEPATQGGEGVAGTEHTTPALSNPGAHDTDLHTTDDLQDLEPFTLDDWDQPDASQPGVGQGPADIWKFDEFATGTVAPFSIDESAWQTSNSGDLHTSSDLHDQTTDHGRDASIYPASDVDPMNDDNWWMTGLEDSVASEATVPATDPANAATHGRDEHATNHTDRTEQARQAGVEYAPDHTSDSPTPVAEEQAAAGTADEPANWNQAATIDTHAPPGEISHNHDQSTGDEHAMTAERTAGTGIFGRVLKSAKSVASTLGLASSEPTPDKPATGNVAHTDTSTSLIGGDQAQHKNDDRTAEADRLVTSRASDDPALSSDAMTTIAGTDSGTKGNLSTATGAGREPKVSTTTPSGTEGEVDDPLFSLHDLGLTPEEMATIEHGTPEPHAENATSAHDDPIFSLADLGLSEDEMDAIAAPRNAETSGHTAPASNEATTFSLADLGLTDEEISQFDLGASTLPSPETIEAASEPSPSVPPQAAPATGGSSQAASTTASTPPRADPASGTLAAGTGGGQPSAQSLDRAKQPGDQGSAVPVATHAAKAGVVAQSSQAPDFDAALEHDPDNDTIRLAVARMNEQMGRLDAALEHYRQLIRRNAFVEHVVDDLSDLIKSEPDQASLRRLHRLLGDAYMKQQRMQEAMAEYSWTGSHSA